MRRLHAVAWTLTLAALAASSGCVRRTMTFRSEPQGARVFLNDQEIGRTPVTVDFTWYGDYDVVARLDGHSAIRTHHRVNPPWYMIWPLDFFSEVLLPVELNDHHDMPLLIFEPLPEPDTEALVQRAGELRDQALYTK